MSEPLLASKLYIPPSRDQWVLRPRLFARLDEGWSMGFALVSAPAGSGKTTLLSAWANQDHVNAAWISLDAADNNPIRLLTYIAAAVHTIEPAGVHETEAALQSRSPLTIEFLLAILLNELTHIADRFVLVLDDYHNIESDEAHDIVLRLIDHAPPQMYLIIATRVNPPLPLARLRGGGQIVELRERDLRFTRDETATFLNCATGKQLSDGDITALHTRTEGWIVGLQLAAISLRDHEEISAFISAFSGSHRYVLDYLTEEVLARQSLEHQQFLLQTSILNRLRAGLCDAVTGQDKGQATLEELDRANLFIVPLDSERRWYRYHHLFAEMLQRTLRRTQGKRIPELHRRASAWYESRDSLSEAISHSVAAEDWDRAAALIDRTMTEMMGRGEFFTTMLDRVESLPEEIVLAYPRIAVSLAWLLQITMQLDAVEPRLQEVERLTGASLSDELRLQIAVIRASLARQQRDTERAISLSYGVLEALPDPAAENHLQKEARIGVAFNLGHTYLWLRADANSAEEWLSQALTISSSVRSLTLTLAAMAELAHAQREQGQLNATEATLRKGLQVIDEVVLPGEQLPPAAAYIHLGLGDLLIERNKLQDASHHIATAIDLCRKGPIPESLCDGYIYQARLMCAQGDLAGAIDILQTAEQMPEVYRTVPRAGGSITLCRAKLNLAYAAQSDDPSSFVSSGSFEHWLHTHRLEPNCAIDTLDDLVELLLWVRLLILRKEPQRVLGLFDRAQQAAVRGGLGGRTIEILVLKALAYQTLDQIDEALTCLRRALTLAEPEGYIRLFIDEGWIMADLLRQASLRGIHADYVSRLLTAYHHLRGAAPAPDARLAEGLSDRELEILRLIAAGLSNPEIAEELTIAVGTVKSHSGSIYGKLGVNSRAAAVYRALELNIL